jgi:hypothetical protein
VAARNGVQRWQRVGPSKGGKARKVAQRYHTIVFGESAVDTNELNRVKFQVSHEFFGILSHKPKELVGADANAFIFGPTFPLNSYVYVDGHGNSYGVAQTGFVDVTNLTREERNALYQHIADRWDDVGYPYTWDRVLFARKAISPRIVFFGETVGGDVGADLFVHRSAEGDIDSVIIDSNQMLFERQ